MVSPLPPAAELLELAAIDPPLGGLDVEPVEEAGVEERPVADVGLVADREASPGPRPGGSTTGITGRPYLRAKSRSRWSCAGQPKIAPVP